VAAERYHGGRRRLDDLARGSVRAPAARAGAVLVSLALALLPVVPVPSSAAEDDTTRALALLNSGCGTQVAQAEVSPSPSPAASASASPSPTPSPSPLVGPPVAPGGPQILVPRPLATSPPPTLPPLPSPSPTTTASAPVYVAPITPGPSPTPKPANAATAGPILPSPSPTAAAPQPAETLGPNDYAILADKLIGRNAPGSPEDLEGHVNIIYQQGVLVGDRAHYDGRRYIDVTGNTYIRNNAGDTIFYADAVRFDTQTQQATLINGRGESTQGVEQGQLHFTARSMVSQRSGYTHGVGATLTTCENPRGGYHLGARTLDVYPGDKAVLHSATLFLGALAVFYLPVVVISLRHDQSNPRRQPGFVPLIGYSQAEGFWIKARVGFSPSEYYYGYYRIEEYTKLGLGLGYVGTIRRRDGRRQTDLNYFRQQNRSTNTSNENFQVADQENFSRTTRGQFGVTYTGNYGPLVTLPPQYDITAALDHSSGRGNRENYSFRRDSTGSQAQTNNYGFTDHHIFTPRLQNDLTVSYTANSTNFGVVSNTQSLHYQTLTHLTSNALDYDLTMDRYDTTTPSNIQKEPELQIRPHSALFPHLRTLPITGVFTLGQYQDPTANLATSRGEAKVSIGPGLAHVLGSDLSAQLTLQQDAYATGDLKAQIGQQATLTTPLFGHMVNTISYTESHVNGPLAEPFKSIDVLGAGNKQANDVLRLFNSNVYTLSLTATTLFNRQAQPVGYQLTARPSRRSTVLLGGSFTPGPGFGFDRTNVQIATPFGYKSDLQFSTFVDWKAHGRLESKNIYYRHVVGDCYEVRISYNQDLKQVNLSVNILAFPSRAANFGIGTATSLNSIIPQSFASNVFLGP
jgi:hypothetical protein